MARTRRNAVKPTALLGSAAQLRTDTDFTKARNGTGWQKVVWDSYDCVGEYRYVCDWLGGMVGKTRLYAGEISGGEVHEVKDGPAAEFVDALFGSPAEKSEIMRQLGIHFTVAGEAILLGTATEVAPGDFVDDSWYVIASSELTYSGPENDRHYRANGEEIPGDSHTAVRVWRPHPLRFGESNSASRAVIGILEQLRTLDAHTMAQLTSRLAGAGLLMLSDQLTLPTRKDAEGNEIPSGSTPDEVIATLAKAMSAALEDRGSASALVPIVLTAPTEAIEASKLMTFWTPLDEHSKELRDEALRRLGLGMDVPPEVVTGVAEANHWAAWASDESGIKAHGEPLAAIVTQALTKGLLWPTLQREGVPDHTRYVIAGDTSAMRLRPNRAKEALELWDRGVLNNDALVRETGFDPDDVPTDEQYARWVLQRIASGSATPEQVAWAAAQLGLEGIPSGEVEEIEVRESRPAPSLREHPEQGPPDQEVGERRRDRRQERRDEGLAASAEPAGPSEALVAACDVAMHRAMERAGNKLRNKVGRTPGVRAVDMYRLHGRGGIDREVLLDDAWDHVRGMGSRLRVNPVSLQAALTAYAEELFETKGEMTPERLVYHLRSVERE